MNHSNLTDLLNLVKLSPENLERILEHDRWKTELILDHELKIEELRNNLLRGNGSETYVYTEEDKEFNLITSGGECGDAQMFKLARTKVKNGITSFCTKFFPAFYTSVTSDERWGTLQEDDRNRLKIKYLFVQMVYFVCCSERVRKWPTAKDKSSFSQVQKELEDRCLGFESKAIELVYNKLVLYWPSMFGSSFEFNDKDIEPIVQDSIVKTTPPPARDIKSSPLFAKTSQQFPHVDLGVLEKYLSIMPFIEAGVKTLTLDFIKNRPSELDHTDEYAEWSDIYISHLHSYKEKWRNQLKEIEKLTEVEQKLWEKEST